MASELPHIGEYPKGTGEGRNSCLIWFGLGASACHQSIGLVNPCIRVAGGSVFSYISDPAEFRRRAAAVIGGIQEGWLRSGEGAAYTLGQAADAHRDLQGRGTQGKLYLAP